MGRGLSITAFVFSFIFPVVGLVLGIIATVKSKDDPNALKGLAIAAIIIGGVLTLITLIIILSVGYMWFAIGNPTNIAVNKFYLSEPLITNGISYNSLNKQIELQFINGDSNTIHVSSVLISNMGCDIQTNNNLGWDITTSVSSPTIKISCPSLNDKNIVSDIEITYTKGTSSINNVVVGNVVVYTNQSSN